MQANQESRHDTRFELVLINTGGTFNKRYDPVSGQLAVAEDAEAVLGSLRSAMANLSLHVVEPVHKDSLEMTAADRLRIVESVHRCPPRWSAAPIVVVHGTDTMHLTAEALERAELERVIVLVGAMRPVEIDPVEGALHLGLALGFVQADPPAGVYVAMHGRVLPHHQLRKDRVLGRFMPA